MYSFKRLGWFSLIFIAVLGFVFSSWIAKRSDRQLREDLLLHAQIAVSTINQDDIKALSFTADDLNNPAFIRLGMWLKRYAHAAGCRSLYTMIKRGDQIVFGPENLEKGDPFASPPGTSYSTPPEKLRTVFESRKAITVGPYTDEYGTFVSAFSPVIDHGTGTVIAVVGMDVEASDWKWFVLTEAALPISLTILLTFLLFLYLKLQKTHLEIRNREATLLESEIKYRQLAETSHDIIVTVDLHFRITYANKAAFKLTGIADPVGLSLVDFTPPHLRPLQEELMQKRREGFSDMLAFEWEIVHPDGKIIIFDIRATLLTENRKPSGVMFVARDVTERKNSEETLRAMVEMLDSAPSSITVHDEEGRFYYANQKALYLHGYTRQEFMNLRLRDLDVPESQARVSERMRLIEDTGEASFEVAHIRKDGTAFPLEVLAKKVNWEGKPAILSIATDITERKKAEDALRVSAAQLFANLENTPNVAIQWYDDRGQVLYWNPASEVMYGWKADEAMGRTLDALIYSPGEAAEFIDLLSEIRSTGKSFGPYETPFRRKDGSSGWLLSTTFGMPMAEGRTGFVCMDVDITKRKQAEDSLRLSEERYRGILEEMEEAYYEIDLKGKFTFFNESMCRTLGYSRDELMGMNNRIYTSPEAARKAYGIFSETYRTGKTRIMVDYEIIRKNGEKRILETSISLMRKPSGEIAGFRGVSRDVTERLHAEAAQREAHQRIERQMRFIDALLSAIPVAVFYKDTDGRYLGCNRAFSEVMGVTPEQIKGKTVYELWPGDLARKYHEQDLDLIRNPKLQIYEWQVKDRNGKTLDVIFCKDVFRNEDGAVAGIIGSFLDITDRKIMEKALEASEARYRLLAENASDIIFTMDKNLAFTYISPSIERIRGYTPQEAILQKPEDALTPESLEVAMKAYAEEIDIETGRTRSLWRTRTLELEERCRDGSTIWTESSFSPIRDEDDNLVGFQGITRDITERKRIEWEKKRLEEQLVRAQKIEAIGTLAGGVAHDFNNLLTGILGNVSLVLLKMDEGSPFRERLKNIEDYVQRGSDLTKQLLGFARGGKYEVRPTDLGEFIRKSAEMFGRTKKQVRIHYNIQDSLWAAEVDRGQMEQVMLNLFVNAWQAMPGGGSLYLSAENARLDERDVSPHGLRPGKYVRITVADTGTGMSEAVRERIFEPFFTTKERDHGTGLGLASVYGIIKNHGGFINVESEVGQGASFIIHLPASEKTPARDSSSARDDVQMGSETILLIDDESMILDIGSRMLEGLGYKVILANGGKEGLQLYERSNGKIDLVILDMIMPELSGKETFNALLDINPSIKVLLSSGYSLDDQAREIMQGGCKGFIQKPFTMMDLSKKLRMVLDQ